MMKRIQLYLDEQLWTLLQAEARNTGATIFDLVREVLQERYLGDLQKRKRAMQALVVLRKDRKEFNNSEAYIRNLRRSSRLDRLNQQ